MAVNKQDGGSKLIYWVNYGYLLGSARILSAQLNTSEMTVGITVELLGLNNAELTDDETITYPANTVLGVMVSGGTEGQNYKIPFLIRCDSGEIINRSITIYVEDN